MMSAREQLLALVLTAREDVRAAREELQTAPVPAPAVGAAPAPRAAPAGAAPPAPAAAPAHSTWAVRVVQRGA